MKLVPILIMLSALFLFACASPEPVTQPVDLPTEAMDPPAEPPGVPTETEILPTKTAALPTPLPVEYYPLDTQTGIPEVDYVLAVVASGDVDEQRALVRFTMAPCTTAEGLGGPPKCKEGQAEGTMMEVLPVLGSEGSYIEKENIGMWPGIDPAGVYAIYRVSESALQEDYFPAGDYIVFFAPKEDEPGIGLRIADGGIVRVDYQFDVFPDSLQPVIERDTSEVILAPQER